MFKHLAFLIALAAAPASAAFAQDSPAQASQPAARASGPATVCGVTVAPPATPPPSGSAPVLWQIAACFEKQGNVTLVDPQTYLYYIQLQQHRSRPSEGVWTPYTPELEQIALADFRRLWNTNFLDDISIDVQDYTFSNGVVGKIVVYNMEERQRVKIVDYAGSKKVESTKIDEKLRELNAVIRMDTFIDSALVKKVSGIIRDMMKEKGFQFATVTPKIEEMAGGPKLIHLTFQMDEGPKVKIRNVDFLGNRAGSDRALRRRMKENKSHWWLSWITGRGTYQENKFEEDAERVLEFYRDRGFIMAQVGDPELRYLGDSDDKQTRWVELRVPVVEGNRYRVGEFNFEGNTVVKAEALRPLFDVKSGEYYSQKKVRKGFQKAQEMYGAGGYFEFTGFPDYKPRDLPNPDLAAGQGQEPVPAPPAAETKGPPIVDVTLRLQEGKQYFVNRITFVGNTTTRDNVIRREMRLYENGVFDTEALKFSIRRINQLGYFKALEGPGKDVNFEKTPGQDNKVDVALKVEEQNRNQLTFGAGVSQFEGFFGQLSFQTANFLGRGESLTVSLQGGQRAQNYTLAFTEPFLFDRNITGGLNLFKNELRYIGQFTQKSLGGAATFGFPLGRGFTRMFTNYSYERVRVSEMNELFNNPELLRRNPFLRDSLLIGAEGERIISKITPSIVHNTVDQPIFPTTGKRLTFSADLAGLGGNTNFYKPMLEGVYIWRQNTRMSLASRAQVEYIHDFSGSKDLELPIFERLFLGGEYSVRGFDIRSIGPQDPNTGLVLGGDKSLLFNVEQNINIAGPVRLILFYDAGQVRNKGQKFSLIEEAEEFDPDAPRPVEIFDPASNVQLTDPNGPSFPTRLVRRSAFKTSTGAEIRFFMPVLNVPFRLIFAYNPQRAGVLEQQTGRQQKPFQFRFAVGTTF